MRSVWTNPGQMALTRTPRWAASRARHGQGVAARGLDAVGDLAQVGFAARGHHDVGPFGGVALGDGATDALRLKPTHGTGEAS